MPNKGRINFLVILKIVLISISIFGIWYLYKKWVLHKRARILLLSLKGQLIEANDCAKRLLNFETYFAFRDELRYSESFKHLRKQIISSFDKVGIDEDLQTIIENFIDTFDNLPLIRKEYNNAFVEQERLNYKYLFDSLESYPLSPEQVEAIIRDEDNNLVVAGAGTGKTTTIAGKVAYILEKKLAKPEELLIISFTKNAVNEMYERCLKFCKHIPDINELEVRTFNSFGYFVKRHCSQDELHLAFDGDEVATKVFLQQTFDNLFLTNIDFQKKATNFIAFFNRPDRDDFAFKTHNDFMKHENSFKNETLDGRKVKSKEEMEIGNFFCLFGIKYEYEKHYPLEPEDRNARFASYHPDFFLPDYGIWHEHFGIDRNGNVSDRVKPKPPFTTGREYYQAGISWKRSIHAKYKTTLIESYSYENNEGKLIANLKKRLLEKNVVLEQIKAEDLLPLIKDSTHYEDFINLIHTFMSLMKSNSKTPEEIKSNNKDRRLKVFLDVFSPIYRQYEKQLNTKCQIDYNDMINQAAEHFNKGDFKKVYKYILVDEFQDTSLGRYALLKGVKKQNPDSKLYAVGDDWQSIFRFTGSDISIITEFKEHFGYVAQTPILKTYRFNDEILDVSSNFIRRNPAQIPKTLTSDQVATAASFEFIESTVVGNRETYQIEQETQIRVVLSEISEIKNDAIVYLIGRYNHNSPARITYIQRAYPNLKIEYYTAHRVKGMTCDYSILLDVNSGTFGFPSEIADDPLLNYLLHEGDTFENAEERRVFYVAITRARHKNYLFYHYINPSKFLTEILTGHPAHTPGSENCPECDGRLVKRKGPYSEFWGCSNFPHCEGKVSIPADQSSQTA